MQELFLVDRIDHIVNNDYGIAKTINRGTSVISGRYYFSSYAETEKEMDWLISMNSLCSNVLKPDLTIFIDISVENAMKRLSIRQIRNC